MIELISEKLSAGGKSFISAHKKIAPAIKGEKSWRLIHYGREVITLFESSGDTRTMWDAFEAPTEQDCLDEIQRLGLEYEEDHGVTL